MNGLLALARRGRHWVRSLAHPAPPASPSEPQAEPQAGLPAAAPIDLNLMLHQGRSALMRDMPPGAARLLSAGCSGNWYFDWVEQTYGHVAEHIGVEYYTPKPEGLPGNVTWISNTVGNMGDVAASSCDLLISGQNIEHLWPQDVAGFLAEAARVLRPGGTLCVDSPNRAVTAPLVWSHPEHTVEYTVPEIARLMQLAGFIVTKSAGIWLCRDPRTGRILHNDPNLPDPDWSMAERLVSGRDKPQDCLLWWLEGQRTEAPPDIAALDAAAREIFAEAWPERVQRLIVPPSWQNEMRQDGPWVRVPAGQGGVVIFGPYMPLRAGEYRVAFTLEPDGGAEGALARFEVTGGADAQVIASAEATPGTRRVELAFALPELVFGIQFRCISHGRGAFAVRRHVDLDEALAEGAS